MTKLPTSQTKQTQTNSDFQKRDKGKGQTFSLREPKGGKPQELLVHVYPEGGRAAKQQVDCLPNATELMCHNKDYSLTGRAFDHQGKIRMQLM